MAVKDYATPSHPDLFSVERGSKPFSTRSVSLVDLPAGAVFAPLTAAESTDERTYATVQASRDHDISLNSDLVFINHSCAPSLVFDMKKMEVRVLEGRDLKKGDELTFFYPSTEWDMQQPFDCTCGAGKACVGVVKGAKYMHKDLLSRYWLNQHIIELLEEHNTKVNGSS